MQKIVQRVRRGTALKRRYQGNCVDVAFTSLSTPTIPRSTKIGKRNPSGTTLLNAIQIRRPKKMPHIYEMRIRVQADTPQDNLHGRKNLSPLAFLFTEFKSQLQYHAKQRGFRLRDVTWHAVEGPQLPKEKN
tara:strand:- start:445 stop:840 length:396 start_codon:yes stop_codon:yes gene_type:complete